jgi:hypothetical protein
MLLELRLSEVWAICVSDPVIRIVNLPLKKLYVLFAAAGMVRKDFPVRVVGVDPDDQTAIYDLGTVRIDGLISAGPSWDPIQNVKLLFQNGKHLHSFETVSTLLFSCELCYVP